VPGVFGRNAVFEDVLARFDAAVTRLATDDAADLDSIPGFSTALSAQRITEVVQDVGCVICGQTERMVLPTGFYTPCGT